MGWKHDKAYPVKRDKPRESILPTKLRSAISAWSVEWLPDAGGYLAHLSVIQCPGYRTGYLVSVNYFGTTAQCLESFTQHLRDIEDRIVVYTQEIK